MICLQKTRRRKKQKMAEASTSDWKKLINEEPKHQCLLCGYVANCDARLETHLDCVHRRLKKFECERCGKRFGRKDNLKKHIETVHEKIRKFSCSHCDATFGERGNLKRHELRHAGAQWRCLFDGCDKVYSSKGDLARHQKVKHLNRGHKCFCLRSFGSPALLARHVRAVHNRERVECDQCDRTYSTKGHLSAHKRSFHHGIRFKCLRVGCGKLFTDRSHLRRHDRSIHQRIRYACPECGQTFTDPSYRRTHYRQHLIRRARQIYSYEYVKHFIRVEAPCLFCGLMFDAHEKLKQHILEFHSNATI